MNFAQIPNKKAAHHRSITFLGVSRHRIHQYVSLIERLPGEIQDFLIENEDPVILRHFTERRLRPLTKLSNDLEKTAQFEEMLSQAQANTGF